MDPVTQGALGAVVAAALAAPSRVRAAAIIGWVGGMLPDADIFIRSASDPLLNLEYHRHFTHALAFIPVGGLMCAAALAWFFRKQLSFALVLLYSTAGYATAGLLDACTSYGTQLLWPFSDFRVSWSIISIVDPLFTLPLLVLLGMAVRKRGAVWARWAAAFSLAYLVFGLVQRERADVVQQRLAIARGHHAIERPAVKPTLGNLVVWRSIYRHRGDYHVDAIRLGFIAPPMIYPGESIPAFDLASATAALPEGSVLANDLRRFDHFSEGYLAALPDRENFITDLRYSPVANSVAPLWGIDFSGKGPQDHAIFVDPKSSGDERRGDLLLTMLLGRPVVPPPASSPDPMTQVGASAAP